MDPVTRYTLRRNSPSITKTVCECNVTEKPLEFELIFYAELYQITRMLAWKVIIVVILTELHLELGVIQLTQIQGLIGATFPPAPVSMNSYAACELMQRFLDLTYHKSIDI